MLLSRLLNECFKLELGCVITFAELNLCSYFNGQTLGTGRTGTWPWRIWLWKLQNELILIYLSAVAGKSHVPHRCKR